MKNIILQGDALTKLKELPEKSINCCMTSPPYWALRDYGVDGQLGLEPTFDEYISNLCDIFDEVKRVLRDDGTCWVNFGDTYYTKSGSGFLNDSLTKNDNHVLNTGINRANELRGRGLLESKNLTLIPFRFALEMQNRGWILRNVIIWHKPNCMPCSVKDRFTVDFEYIFFFSKKKKYYFETQYEPLSEVTIKDIKKRKNMACLTGEKGSKHFNNKNSVFNSQKTNRGRNEFVNLEKGRNKRTVWSICPKPFKEAHFAVYPEELCETPIKAGCPEFVCKKCGMPKIKVEKIIGHQITESMRIAGSDKEGKYYGTEKKDYKSAKANEPSETKKRILESMSQIKEYNWTPTCKCHAGFTGGIVLDPFFGSGTTGLVALKQNKNFIGIELNPEYIEIAEKRLKPFLKQTTLNLNKESQE